MKIRRIVPLVLAGLATAGLALAHDMFLKPTTYFVAENGDIPAVLLNGTFTLSSNSIERNRLADLSIVSPAGRVSLDTMEWSAEGDTSRITYHAGSAGTYVLGVSTQPTHIELEARDFNEYLRTDGLPDELARRRRAGELQRDAHERYSKHVKSIVQVGERMSEDFTTVLGYPAEIVPIDNPYRSALGGRFRFRVLVDGAPVPNAYVLYGGTTPSGGRIAELGTRTDADGVGQFRVTSRGVWYLKYISMVRLPANPEGYTHESKWATLTFARR
ncbi:MAG: DUF4198 domain-containing protein [Gemmatimonadales bacterium]